MKKFAKIFMIVACLAMVFCFTAGVSAAEANANDVTVTINFRIMDRDDDPTTSYPITENPLTVTADLDDTLYDVIVAANLGALWDTVPIVIWNEESQSYVPTGENAKALTSLTLDGVPYVNQGEYTSSNSYSGTNWMWYYGTPSQMPELSKDYPNTYLDKVKVRNLASYNYNFTLSYETETMTW